MSSVAISNSWTLDKLRYIFSIASQRLPNELLPPPPPEGTSLLLGWIPLTFSLALFLIPIIRASLRNKKKKEIDAKNGKRGLFCVILTSSVFTVLKKALFVRLGRKMPKIKPMKESLLAK